MKIVIFGATGNVGRRTVTEALARGHEVRAVARNAARLEALPDVVDGRCGNIADPDEVAALTAGWDVAINAARPPAGCEKDMADMTCALMSGLADSGARLLVSGGAATLRIPGSDGLTVLEDARYLPVAARHIGQASKVQYQIVTSDKRVDWTYFSPPASLQAGERTGRYRLGRDELIVDDDGNSVLSMEDLAVVLLDEAENPWHRRLRFTAAY